MSAQTSAPPGARWFALHTLSGQENKVKTYIEKFKKAEELDDYIFEILLPTEVVSEVKGGKTIAYPSAEFNRLDRDRPGDRLVSVQSVVVDPDDRLWLLDTGSIEFGPTANSFIHMWPYPSVEARNEVRTKAAAAGGWPPAGGEHYLTQQNKLLLPASYSPAQ